MFVFQSVAALTALRAEPRDDAERVTEALPGEPLAAEATRGAWTRVRTAYGYPGWLPTDSLTGECDPDWLKPTAPDPLTHARTFVGCPYLWGGMTKHGIDCSGLVHMSYRAAGRLVPRDAAQQEEAGTAISRPGAGDLISYGDGRRADHVAFWLGDGRILHATGRDGVRAVIDEMESEELIGQRRIAFRL